jgi:hypothetical protein
VAKAILTVMFVWTKGPFHMSVKVLPAVAVCSRFAFFFLVLVYIEQSGSEIYSCAYSHHIVICCVFVFGLTRLWDPFVSTPIPQIPPWLKPSALR